MIVTSTDSNITQIPDSITDNFPSNQSYSLDNIDTNDNNTSNKSSPSGKSLNSHECRKLRRQHIGCLPIPQKGSFSKEDWLSDLQKLPPSTILSLHEQVLLDYPNCSFKESFSPDISGTNYKCTLPRYSNGKPLCCSSAISTQDAKDKLLGYFIALLGSLPTFTHYCYLSQSCCISSTFKRYMFPDCSHAAVTNDQPAHSAQDDVTVGDTYQPSHASGWWKSILQTQARLTVSSLMEDKLPYTSPTSLSPPKTMLPMPYPPHGLSKDRLAKTHSPHHSLPSTDQKLG